MPFPIFLILIVYLPYLSCLVKFHRPHPSVQSLDKPSTLTLSHLKDLPGPNTFPTSYSSFVLYLHHFCSTRLILSNNHLFDTSIQTEKFSHVSTLHNSTSQFAWFWTAVGCHGKLLHCMVNLKRLAPHGILWSLSLLLIIFRKLYSSFQHRFSRKISERWSSNSAKRSSIMSSINNRR